MLLACRNSLNLISMKMTNGRTGQRISSFTPSLSPRGGTRQTSPWWSWTGPSCSRRARWGPSASPSPATMTRTGKPSCWAGECSLRGTRIRTQQTVWPAAMARTISWSVAKGSFTRGLCILWMRKLSALKNLHLKRKMLLVSVKLQLKQSTSALPAKICMRKWMSPRAAKP